RRAQDRRQCGPGARRPRLYPRSPGRAAAPRRAELRHARRARHRLNGISRGVTTMIDFKPSEGMQNMRTMTHMLAEQAMRPISRECDEKEHEKPWDFLNMMWGVSRGATMTGDGGERKERKGPSEQNLGMCMTVEELCWGDVGLYLSIPNPGLGGAAVAAAGTPEQKERFLARFKGEKPTWGAMAITEPGAGSDSAAIQATAVRDGDHWVLNGTKI